ncbi:MAG TPA: DUF2330 domain-containing protein [Thermoanaerobaculia bacterium]|nr:DUF2330 domain-containing protein [Thermoanaerobaculia bacterium]
MRHIAAVILLAGASRVFACAPAPRAGEEVRVVEESAVIVWDPATKTEHFIRRATFHGGAHDFGFLVPTPSAPVLTAVSDRLFDILADKTVRQVVDKRRREIDWTPLVLLYFTSRKSAEIATAAAPVEVVSTARVAGYEAVILDVSDASALQGWLRDHEYAATPDLEQWARPYVDAHWKITAFKIDKTQSELYARTEAVKMSFGTERPFFPYREPASQPADDGRSLRVFFLGPQRVRGTIGAELWPGFLQWSNTLDADTRAEVAKVSGVAIAEGTRLTASIDTSRSRPGNDDLFFVRDVDQRPYAQPPLVREYVETTNIPLDVVLVPIMLIAFFLRRRMHAQKT